MDNSPEKPVSSKSLAVRLALLTVAMFAFGVFLLPPLYDVFCEVTGLGGKTNQTAATVEETAATDRTVRLEFDTTVNQYAPWEFSSDLDVMTINTGGIYETTFTARNLTDRDMVARAVPSVSPPQAAKYFKKLECFCFSTQEFAANEEKQMPVRFIIGSDLPEHIDTVTLSYTFYDTARVSGNAAPGASSAHPNP